MSSDANPIASTKYRHYSRQKMLLQKKASCALIERFQQLWGVWMSELLFMGYKLSYVQLAF